MFRITQKSKTLVILQCRNSLSLSFLFNSTNVNEGVKSKMQDESKMHKEERKQGGKE